MENKKKIVKRHMWYGCNGLNLSWREAENEVKAVFEDILAEKLLTHNIYQTIDLKSSINPKLNKFKERYT